MKWKHCIFLFFIFCLFFLGKTKQIKEITYKSKNYKPAGILSMDISSDGNTIVSGGDDKITRIWNIRGQDFRILGSITSPIVAVSFSPDESKVLARGDENTAILWDTDGTQLRVLSGHSGWVRAVEFSPDGSLLYTGSDDGTIKVWTLEGKEVTTLKGHTEAVTSIVISDNGEMLVSAGDDCTIRIWNKLGKQIKVLKGHKTSVITIAISRNGKFILSGGFDDKAILWNETGEIITVFNGHTSSVNSVAFSPNGEYVITGSSDNTAIVWDLSGNIIAKLKKHTESVTGVRFLTNGNTVITASMDGSYRIWDLQGNCLCTVILTDHGKIYFSSDGRFDYDESHSLESIYFCVNNCEETVELEQIHNKFYTPNLLYTLMENKHLPTIESMSELLVNSPPPKITISQDSKENDLIFLSVTACDNGGGVQDVEMYHNGALIENTKKGVVLSRDSSCKIEKYVLNLAVGINKFQATAKSKKGVEGYSNTISLLQNKKDTIKPSMHLVLIGVNEYRNPSLRLKYAVADAVAIKNKLKTKNNTLYKEVYTYEVYNQQANLQGIRNIFKQVSQNAKEEDVTFIFFSGHGYTIEQIYYFLQYDNLGNNEKAIKNGLSQKELVSMISKIKTSKKLVVLDSCQSGGEWMLALKGMEELSALGFFAKKAGVWVLAASLSNQLAMEATETGHGLLTSSILECLNKNYDKDGMITVGDLVAWVNRRVPELALKFFKREQFPYSVHRGQDFPLVDTKIEKNKK